MSKLVRVLAVLAVLGAAPSLFAGDPRISIVQRGSDHLLEDFKYMMELSEAGEAEWPNMEGFFDAILLPGIDGTQPLRFDLVLGEGGRRYVSSFPLQRDEKGDLDEGRELFFENLSAFDIDMKKKGENLWFLDDGAGFTGWLRIVGDYATIGVESGDVPANLAARKIDIATVLEANYGLAVELVNAEAMNADAAARMANFRKNVIDELLAGMKQPAKDESIEDFRLRKSTVGQQLEEVGRYYSETKRAVVGWNADVENGVGTADIELDPIAGTSLHTAVGLLGRAPSHFANVPKANSSILSLRLNHPLDDLKKKHFADFYALLNASIKARVDASTRKNAAEKTAAKKVSDLVIAMFAAGANAGVADGFAEIARVDTVHVGVIGVKSPNGKAADAILALLPQSNAKIEVALNKATVKDVAIHEVTLPLADLPDFEFLFGQHDTLFVGTSADTVWVAAGPNARESLEQAINLVAEPNTGKAEDPFLDLQLDLLPWMKYRDRKAGEEGGDAALRKIVLDALAEGDDTLSITLSRENDGVRGKMSVQEGILRMVGSMMADFSKENLQ